MSSEIHKVFVTGADGFIGSHLVEHLASLNYEVRALNYYNSFTDWGWLEDCSAETLRSVEVVSGDIRDPSLILDLVTGCDAIIHLASLIAIPYSYRAPMSYVDTNISGTLNILEAARKREIRKVIHTSTSEVYGTAQFVPMTEDHPLNAQSPYAASKIAADQLAKSFYYSFDTPVGIVRPFNTFGPRQSARAFIPTVISQILNKQKEIVLGNMNITRDFTFVSDTVKGFELALRSQSIVGKTVNLGTGLEVNLADLVKLISELLGAEVVVIQDPQRSRPKSSEVERLCASNSLAKEVLGWKPEFSGHENLAVAISKTIDWFRREDNLRRYKPEIYVR